MKPYMTTKYKDLSYLTDLKIIRAWKSFTQEPEKVEFIKDYGKTVLIKLTFAYSEYYGYNCKPRSYLKMLPKSALACADIVIKDLVTENILTGEEITKYFK